jgi:D-methionine transport system permease protein
MWYEHFHLLWPALLETLYMVFVSGGVSVAVGVPIGVLLFITRSDRLMPMPGLHHALSVIVNAARSIPFIILMVAIIPLTRLIAGTSIGTTAAIVPLTLGAIPFVARIVEASITEVPNGLVEAGKTMGATPYQIVSKILLPEAFPGLIHGVTLTLVTLVGYSAMAGAIVVVALAIWEYAMDTSALTVHLCWRLLLC